MKRDAEFIKSQMYVKDNKLYCKSKTIIEFPKFYEGKNLLEMSKLTSVYGVFCTIVNDKYSVSLIPAMITTQPLIVDEVEKNDMEYYQFLYAKDSVLIDNLTVIKNKLLSYEIFNNLFMLNKMAWFLEYEDLVRLMDNLPRYADSGIGDNPISNEVIVSFVTRYKNDPMVFHRNKLKEPYMYVDLNDVYYSAKSTLNKIAGNYFNEGLISAINMKETTPTALEKLVRQ